MSKHAKKILFPALLAIIPVFTLLLVEGSLRILHIGEAPAYFVHKKEGALDLVALNPEVTQRYFYRSGNITPKANKIWFEDPKDQETFRVFVMGGSSAAGYPHSGNAVLSSMLQDRLEEFFPLKQVEVINAAITAVNSFTVLDLLPKLLDYRPDALILYMGHNEYYGALGAASTENISNWIPWNGLRRLWIRTYLALQDLHLFRALQDLLLGDAGDIPENTSTTLMARLSYEQKVPFGGKTFLAGLDDFEVNLDRILHLTADKGVPVILSTVVSNVRDFTPFMSAGTTPDGMSRALVGGALDRTQHTSEDLALTIGRLRKFVNSDPENPHFYFGLGQAYLQAGYSDSARQALRAASDFDALRFRAPSGINAIIRRLARKYDVNLVAADTAFALQSPDGLPGNNLFLEHLHPNLEGYKLLSSILARPFLRWSDEPLRRETFYRGKFAISPLEEEIANIKIHALMNQWPFPSGDRSRKTYQSLYGGLVDDFAWRSFTEAVDQTKLAAALTSAGDSILAARMWNAVAKAWENDYDLQIHAAMQLTALNDWMGGFFPMRRARDLRSLDPRLYFHLARISWRAGLPDIASQTADLGLSLTDELLKRAGDTPSADLITVREELSRLQQTIGSPYGG